MTEAAPIGHNKPPLGEVLVDAYRSVVAEVAEVVAAGAEIAAVASDEQDRAATAIALDLKTLRDLVEASEETEKRPHLDATATVRGFFRPLVEKIDAELARLRAKVNDYKRRVADAARRAEEDIARLAREEAARMARQAAEERARGQPTTVQDVIVTALERRAADATAAAAAPIASTTRVVDRATGARSTAHAVWAFEVVVRGKIPLEELRPFLTDKAIDAAVAGFVKEHSGTRQLEGVRIYEDSTVHFKRGRR